MAINNKNKKGSSFIYDIIIRNTNLASMCADRPQIEKSVDIAIKDGKIAKIASIIPHNAIKEIDGTQKLVTPGFINLHSHVCMSVFRFTNQNYSTVEWLQKIVFPIEAKFTKEISFALAKYGLLESISNGITSTCDMYFNLEQLIAANYNYHVNLYLCKGIMDLKDGVKSFAESMDLFKKINKDNYLFGIQGLYTSSPKYFHKNVEYAIKNNFRLHMHFCEEPNESKLIKKQHNVQHCIQPLEKHLSKFRNQIILAHCVVLDEYDHNVIKKYRNIINIAHCPISNAMLRCGVCDVIKFLQNGVNVCIATDGQGSCNSLSMLVNMRNMYFTQNIRDNKFMENVTAYEILKMATVNPAKALGISKIRGSLDIGMSADLLIFNFKNIRMFPIHDLLTDLVFNANEGDIDYVIVNGQIIVNERKIIYDERKLIISQIHKIKHILFKKD